MPAEALGEAEAEALVEAAAAAGRTEGAAPAAGVARPSRAGQALTPSPVKMLVTRSARTRPTTYASVTRRTAATILGIAARIWLIMLVKGSVKAASCSASKCPAAGRLPSYSADLRAKPCFA